MFTVPNSLENYVDSKIAVIYILELLFPSISSKFHHPSLQGIKRHSSNNLPLVQRSQVFISGFLFSWLKVSVPSGVEILYLSTTDFLSCIFSFMEGQMVPTQVFILGAEDVFPSEWMVARWHPEVSSWLNIMSRAVKGWKLPFRSEFRRTSILVCATETWLRFCPHRILVKDTITRIEGHK